MSKTGPARRRPPLPSRIRTFSSFIFCISMHRLSEHEPHHRRLERGLFRQGSASPCSRRLSPTFADPSLVSQVPWRRRACLAGPVGRELLTSFHFLRNLFFLLCLPLPASLPPPPREPALAWPGPEARKIFFPFPTKDGRMAGTSSSASPPAPLLASTSGAEISRASLQRPPPRSPPSPPPPPFVRDLAT